MSSGFVESWKTKVDHTPKLGEEFIFPTLTGPAKFTVIEMRGNHCIIESGNLQGRITRDEEGEWFFKHMLWQKGMKIKATISDTPARPSPMNPNIGFTKKYK